MFSQLMHGLYTGFHFSSHCPKTCKLDQLLTFLSHHFNLKICHSMSLTVLNMSTSAQLTFPMPADFTPARVPDSLSPIAYFPYFQNTYLAVAASLNGGNVLATFVAMLTSWMKEFGNYTTIFDKPCSIYVYLIPLKCVFPCRSGGQ